MLALQDLYPIIKTKDKYGFALDMSSEALDALIRERLVLPDGDLERIHVDPERLIMTFYYRSDKPETNEEGKVKQPCAGRIGQAGEYPRRGYDFKEMPT